MSKRAQTTGAPKRRRRRRQAELEAGEQSAQEQAESSYTSRAEREEQLQRWVIRGVAAVVGILLLLVAVAFAFEQFIIPNQLVATVHGQGISVREFQQEYLLERNRLMLQLNQAQNAGFELQQLAQQEPYSTWINEANVPDQLALRVLNDMVDDRLLAHEAEARQVSVDEEALQRAIESYFGYDPTEAALIGVEPTVTPEPTITPTPYVSPTPSPTRPPTATPMPADSDDADDQAAEPAVTAQPTPIEPTLSATQVRENFEENESEYRAYFDRAGVAAEALDSLFERNALEAQLAQALVPDGASLLYADVRHILVEDEATALDAIAALNAGESFAALARAISTDPGSAARGGELGEAYVGNYVLEFRRAIEAAEVGAIVGPVESEFGFHVLQARSKEQRGGDDVAAQRERARQQELQILKDSLRDEQSGNFEIYDSWLDHIPRA